MTKVLSVYMYAKLARHVIYNGVDTNTKTNLDEKQWTFALWELWQNQQ